MDLVFEGFGVLGLRILLVYGFRDSGFLDRLRVSGMSGFMGFRVFGLGG